MIFVGKNCTIKKMKERLPSVKQLLRQTLQIFKARWRTLAAIYAIPYSFLLISVFISGFFEVGSAPGFFSKAGAILPLPLLILFVLFWALISFWAGVAAIIAVRDREKGILWKECYRQAWPLLWMFFIAFLLKALVNIGAIWLFIIPAVIWAMWLSMTSYVVAKEKKSGFSALKRSKFLVSGYWWPVLGRWLAFMGIVLLGSLATTLATAVLGAIMGVLGETVVSIFKLIINLIFQFGIGVFAFTYGYLLYENLARIKGEGEDQKSWIYVLFMTLGILMFFVPVVLLVAINPAGQMKKARDVRRTTDQEFIEEALDIYFEEKGAYPDKLEVLAPDYLLSVTDPETKKPYEYFSDGRTYRLCIDFEEKGRSCFTP